MQLKNKVREIPVQTFPKEGKKWLPTAILVICAALILEAVIIRFLNPRNLGLWWAIISLTSTGLFFFLSEKFNSGIPESQRLSFGEMANTVCAPILICWLIALGIVLDLSGR